MLNQLIVARSLTQTERVDIVRAGRQVCAFQAWVHRITEGSARRGRRMLRWLHIRPAG